MIHPIIALFQTQAEILDARKSRAGLDEAIANLAAWMDVMQDQLSEDDWAILCGIGGTLYRAGLAKRP
jgi:hypothetical protein